MLARLLVPSEPEMEVGQGGQGGGGLGGVRPNPSYPGGAVQVMRGVSRGLVLLAWWRV